MNNYSDWNQCEVCQKMCLLSDLNEDGLCPTCAADDKSGASAWELEESEEE
jgi:hypothetical protein